MAEASINKHAEARWTKIKRYEPSRKTAGLVTLRESRMNAAGNQKQRLPEGLLQIRAYPRSSAAEFRKQVLRLSRDRTRAIDGGGMFIRFVSGEIDEDSRVSAGLFCAAFELRWADDLPQYEFDLLSDLREWFDVHLESPTEHLPRDFSYERAVCWFKPTAREHLARAWELVTILERNDVLIWTIKSQTTGRVYYEDEAQVFAVPSRDLRPLCRR